MIHLEPGIYCFYNRANHNKNIFHSLNDYNYFITRSKRLLQPCCNILGWCLLPDLFQFIIKVSDYSLSPVSLGKITTSKICNAFRLLQSSYTKRKNKQEGKIGSLFQQKVKFEFLEVHPTGIPAILQHLHDLPVRAGLVSKPGDWTFSSFREKYNLPGRRLLCNAGDKRRQPAPFPRLNADRSTRIVDKKHSGAG